MEPTEWPRRTSWTAATAAGVYERGQARVRGGRPSTSRWRRCGTGPGLRALDLGAGTGKLTRLLIDRGGADASRWSRRPACAAVLARGVPAADVIARLRRGDAAAGRARSTSWWPGRRSTGSTGPARCRRSPGCCGRAACSRSSTTRGTTAWPGCGRCPTWSASGQADHVSRMPDRAAAGAGPAVRPVELHRTPHEQRAGRGLGLVDLVAPAATSSGCRRASGRPLLVRVAELPRSHPRWSAGSTSGCRT